MHDLQVMKMNLKCYLHAFNCVEQHLGRRDNTQALPAIQPQSLNNFNIIIFPIVNMMNTNLVVISDKVIPGLYVHNSLQVWLMKKSRLRT